MMIHESVHRFQDTRESANPSIAVEDQLTSLEGILFEALQTRGEYHPRILSRTPQISTRQVRKLSPQTIDVLGGSKQPHPIRRRQLLSLAQATQQLLVEIDISLAKCALHRRANR